MRIEKRADVGVQNPVHLPPADSDRQGVQRVMLAAAGADPIREPEEVLLVNRVQRLQRRPLDDFVFHGGDRQGPPRAVTRGLPSAFGMNRRRAGSG